MYLDNHSEWVKRIGQHHLAQRNSTNLCRTTLCGQPMLGNNYVQAIPAPRRLPCPECAKQYMLANNVKATTNQVNKLIFKWEQIDKPNKHNFYRFLDEVQSTIGCDGALTVPWSGMWLCIERDGYCHT